MTQRRNPLLDNIVWHSLTGPHASYSSGNNLVRRYTRGYSQLVGFANPAKPDFAGLARWCEPDEHLYCSGWTGPVPAGWTVHAEGPADILVWDGALPEVDESLTAIRLHAEHVPQAYALVKVTRPGPFGDKTIELGDWYGVFEERVLVAMTGERLAARELREISGVCTLPEFQGRGLARRLVRKVVRLQMLRGQTPFLHVMHDNESALGLYLRMGFKPHAQAVIRVIARTS